MAEQNRNLSEPEQWPFHPRYLTEKVPEELITLIITGISERLAAPVELFQPSGGRDFTPGLPRCPLYPINHISNFNNYPKFCLYFQTKVLKGDKLCYEDNCLNSLEVLRSCSPGEVILKRCHLGLANYMARIEVLGHPLAVFTSGKFILANEEDKVRKKLADLEERGMLSREHREQLEHYAQRKDCQREQDMEDFKGKFKKEINQLNNMVEHYLFYYRQREEHVCREKIYKYFYQAADDPEKLHESLERALAYLRKFLSVRYLALFLSLREGDRVLPLVAQDGLPVKQVDSAHFNWEKANLPSVLDKSFTTTDWLRSVQNTPEFPDWFIYKGVRGPGSRMFHPATFLLPIGNQYRGVLLVGEWIGPKNYPNPMLIGPFGPLDFLQSLGQLLVTDAITKRALNASEQHDRRRNMIMALTAHSIRSALHRLWNYVERIRRLLKKPDSYDDIIKISEGIEQNILSMKKNMELVMAVPETTFYPPLHPSEMELEDINIAALIHNVVDSLKPQANFKEVTFWIDEEVNNLPLIRGDRYMLELVFANILENAVKYSISNKEVRICCQDPITRKDMHLKVTNLGWGIPEEDLEKIFELGFKSSQVNKLRPRGFGLGLYQAQGFIQLHGGTIWATSRPSYEGGDLRSHIVNFFIKLPAK